MRDKLPAPLLIASLIQSLRLLRGLLPRGGRHLDRAVQKRICPKYRFTAHHAPLAPQIVSNSVFNQRRSRSTALLDRLGDSRRSSLVAHRIQPTPNSLLIITHVPLRYVDGQVGMDHQTCQGISYWASQFDRVIYASPVMSDEIAKQFDTSVNWKAIAEVPYADRIEIVPLPYAYSIHRFLRTYAQTQKILRTKIQESEYLVFSPYVIFGDWASVACQEAIKLGRPYAVWQDRVEYEVIARTLSGFSLKRRLKEQALLPLVKIFNRDLIRKSALGFFQGQDCYTTFAPLCPNSYCMYDVHTQKADQINAADLAQKIAAVKQGEPLKIAYAGRAADMKGPLDWVRILHRIIRSGVPVEATWIGDGPLLSDMEALAHQLGIAEHLHFVGYVSEHDRILSILRDQHVFLFCHKTPESPRCLIESLVVGCPIIGYDSAYPRGLVTERGGGIFSPLNNEVALAEQMIELNRDRDRLAEVIRAAAQTGRMFDEESVLLRRGILLKKAWRQLQDRS